MVVAYVCVLSLLMGQLSSAGNTFTSQSNVHIGVFLPLSQNVSQGSLGRGVVPAIKLAARHINSSPLILKDYRLHTQFYDTKCDAAVGMKAFFDMLHDKPHKLILFGAACTAVTDPIAKSSQFFQLAQLTYADTHPMYTRDNYPNFFRVVPSETAFNPARVALLKYYNWTRVGTLYQHSPRYDLPHSKLLTDLDSASVTIVETQGLVEELQHELLKLKNKDVRIILGNFDEEWARKIFCEAYRLNMYGRKYQWIIVGMYQERWWEVRDLNSSCTTWELVQAMEGHIATDVLPLSSSENITVSGLTAAEYAGQYDKKREKEYSRFHGYAYDGIWAIALAIQSVAQKLKPRGKLLKEFQYRDPFWGQLFKDAFNETLFTGVTGPVSFTKNERRSHILIKQFQNGSEVKIGEYDPSIDELDFNKGVPIIWGGGGPPADRTHRKIAKKRISITVYSILVAFAVLGIIIATVFLVVNIKYRNQRYIKMSSPYLNNIIVVGCMLTYTSVILLGMDSGISSETNFPYVCAARAWVLMSGFTLAFGSMFSKTWRVHAIFTNIKLNKKIIKDYKLFMVVGVLVLIDVIILTTWQIVDPFYRKTTTGAPLPSPENEDIEIIPELEFCQSNNMTIFLGSIYAYKGLLMAFGCFLAWETRHVSIPALNDSKYIGMSVYNVVIMCVIGAALSFVLREQQDAAFVIISIFIMFCSTTTLCLVFVPKVRLLLELWANPHAGDRRVRATLKPLKKSRRSSDEDDLQYNMQLLQDENRRFRQRYEDVSVELQKLNLRLREANEPVILVTHGYDMTSPIVELPSLEVSEEDSAEDAFAFQRRPSMPVRSHAISLPKRRMSEISVRLSTMSERESSYVRTDESSVQMSSPPPPEDNPPPPTFTFEEAGGGGPRYRQLQPRSLLDEAAAVKFADSDSSDSCGGRRADAQESDDTSYAKAIQNTQRKKSLMNGLSSSADEDTDKLEMGTFSEADSDTNARIIPGAVRSDVRRRAKSLGALREPTRRTSYGTVGPQAQVSVIHNRRTDPGLVPLFPYISHIMNTRKSPNDDESTPLYSSYPSVKCDIVEYL